MKIRLHCACSAVIASIAISSTAASAQQSRDTVRLSDIVITATKLPTPTTETGAAVTVLSGADLRERGVRRVVDALRTVPGVAVAQLGGPGAVASVFMRGGESDYVQVLVDGVQVNDPGGSYDWAHLTTDDIERIEIVRGPVSVLYGSDAVAGVIQIFTRGGTSRMTGRAQLLGGRGPRVGQLSDGSYSALDWNASLGGGADLSRSTVLRYAATASNLQSDGAYAFNNDYDNQTLSGRLSLARAQKADVAFTARHIDQTFHYPTSGGGDVVDHNKYTNGESLALGLDAGFRLTSHMEARAQLASYRSETGGANPADNVGDGFDNSTADVRRRTADVRLNASLPRDLIATLGVEGEHERGATTFDSDGPFGPFSSESSAKRSNTAYYAQLLLPYRAVSASGGVRVDDNEQFGRFTTGRVSASVGLLQTLRLRASYGTGFKEPTFLEAYATGFAVGDPDLQPETSRSAEAGAELKSGGVVIGATYFDQRFRNLIQYTFSAPAGEPNYYNIGAATARGLELSASASPIRALSLEGQFTYVDTNVTDDGFGEDRAFAESSRLLRRPSHQASITGRSRITDSFNATASVIYTGERDDLDFTDPVEFAGKRVVLESHVTVDASATYLLPVRGAATSLLVRVSNLLDERYDEVYNFPAAGRLIWLGASIELGRR